MQDRSTFEKTMQLSISLLLFASIASLTSAESQKLVIDEYVNPHWIDDAQLEFSRTVDGRLKRLLIDRETGVI